MVALDFATSPERETQRAAADYLNTLGRAGSPTEIGNLVNAFVAGANDYITKPLNRIELIARVRAALKLKSELERRLARERELMVFMSKWGDKHATAWIDEATGLCVCEVAEGLDGLG